jgi:hypothetical protein
MERPAAPALRERDHNFRHFGSFLILAHLVMKQTGGGCVDEWIKKRYFQNILPDLLIHPFRG